MFEYAGVVVGQSESCHHNNLIHGNDCDKLIAYSRSTWFGCGFQFILF